MVKTEFDNRMDRATVLLYGEIGDSGGDGLITSREVVEQLAEIDRRGYPETVIRINSVGGEVFAGLAIFNAIRRMQSGVTVQIDGVAASIAAIIALAGCRVEMGRYSKMMLHSVSAGFYGTKEELRSLIGQLDGLEETLTTILRLRTGLSATEVRGLWFDGQDHWLDAEEALGLKLIDSIYDTDPVPAGSTPDEIYTIFTNRLDPEPQNPRDMDIERIKRIPRFAACADEGAVLDELAATAARAETADELEADNAALQQRVNELETERITAAIDAAVADGRIGEHQRETYTNLLRADFSNGMEALNGHRRKRLVSDAVNPDTPGGGTPRNAWQARMDEIRNRRK